MQKALLERGGSGAELALARPSFLGCVSFVGGRDAGSAIATRPADSNRRHVLEPEGLNCWGIWETDSWDVLGTPPRLPSP